MLCQMHDIIVRVGGMSWPQTGATHYHVESELPNKGRVIKEMVG